MHEYSVVQALLNQCEEVAEQNNATKINKVITKIGVIPVLDGEDMYLMSLEME